MTDEELIALYGITDATGDDIRRGSEAMAMVLAEIGYQSELVDSSLRILNGPLSGLEMYRAQNIGRIAIGAPTFPDFDTCKAFWAAWRRRADLAVA